MAPNLRYSLLFLVQTFLLISQSSARYITQEHVLAPCASNRTHTVMAGDDCGAIARIHSVSRGTLIVINDIRPDCSNLRVGQVLCLPERCRLHSVNWGDTCLEIADSANITLGQLLAWNPHINAECTNLLAGDQICVSQAGQSPTPTTSVTPTAIQKRDYATATVSPPGPVPSGTTPRCGRYYQVQRGDYCDSVAYAFNLSLELFQAINPAINEGCTNLVPGLYYCVSPTPDWRETATVTATSTYISAPAPTATGTTPNCYEWYVVQSGDTCLRIAALHGITVDDLRFWNPSVREDCANLRVGHAYCVHGNARAASSPRMIGAKPTEDARVVRARRMVRVKPTEDARESPAEIIQAKPTEDARNASPAEVDQAKPTEDARNAPPAELANAKPTEDARNASPAEMVKAKPTEDARDAFPSVMPRAKPTEDIHIE